jgi:hypothetical protein
MMTETRSYGPAAHAVALHPLRCGHELQRHGLQFCLVQVDRTQCLLRPAVDLHEGITRVALGRWVLDIGEATFFGPDPLLPGRGGWSKVSWALLLLLSAYINPLCSFDLAKCGHGLRLWGHAEGQKPGPLLTRLWFAMRVG